MAPRSTSPQTALQSSLHRLTLRSSTPSVSPRTLSAAFATEGGSSTSGGSQSPLDPDQVLEELRSAKREVDIAYRQFNAILDPLLIDHVIFRLGAAEKRFHYLLNLARRMQIHSVGFRWDIEGRVN